MIIISPHLDDAVLSCGQLLAAYPHSTVITVFAGIPPVELPLTDFDRACGFSSGAEAVSARREEDRRAAAVLDFEPVWLDFLDGQYTGVSSQREITAAIRDALDSLPDYVVLGEPWLKPLGVAHPDHELVAMCCNELSQHFITYEDLPGRVLYPQRVPSSWESIELVAGPAHLKQAAIACYRSQHVLPELAPPWHSCLVPERYWRTQ